MSQKMVPAEQAFAEWRQDADYKTEYDSVEDEFARASALIAARSQAGLTHAEIAALGRAAEAVIVCRKPEKGPKKEAKRG